MKIVWGNKSSNTRNGLSHNVSLMGGVLRASALALSLLIVISATAIFSSGFLSSPAAAAKGEVSTASSRPVKGGQTANDNRESYGYIAAPSTGVSIKLLDGDTTAIPNATNGINTVDSNVTVSSTDLNDLRYGYSLTMQGTASSVDLINNKDNNSKLTATTGTLAAPADLADNTWGYRLENTAADKYIGLTKTAVAIKSPANLSTTTDTTKLTFAAKFNLDNLSAGTYSTTIQYTVTANLPPAPTITTLTTAHTDDATNTANYTDYNKAASVTMTGTNLLTASKVWVDLNDDGQQQDNELATNVKPLSETQLTYTTPTDTKPGIHDTYVISDGGTASTKNTATTNRYSYIAPSICKSGDANSTCAVDIDTNMIPVKYASTDDNGNATWHAITNPKTATDWYDYNNKQWANAVTVKDPTKYSNGDGTYKDLDVADADILGFYVYVPRYEYEVQRRDATDKVVQAQDYDIRFVKAPDIKKSPVKSCNSGITTVAQMWKNGTADNAESNILAKDYRTGCNLNRTNYPSITTDGNGVATTLAQDNANQTTWTTHPAFTWMTDPTRELNGFWMGKFETTGSTTAPTVRPNEKHIANVTRGVYFDIAKSMGLKDDANTGGNGTTTTQNNQHLAKYQSHALIQTEWGAAAYLSASKYGVGVNKVQINAQSSGARDDNGNFSYGITGCGPQASGNESSYANPGTIKTVNACYADDTNHGYTGKLGMLASTTGNITGIYDMSGGAYEQVMGNLTTSDTQTTPNDVNYFKNPTKPPYVNLYKASAGFGTRRDWSIGTSNEWIWNWDVCTYETCGGQALHENKMVQSVSALDQSWGSDGSNFTRAGSRWPVRGGYSYSGSYAGVFYSGGNNGGPSYGYAFRAVLLPLP